MSYPEREDALFQRLLQILREAFGEAQIAMMAQIRRGQKTADTVMAAVNSCDVLVAVIGDRWTHQIARSESLSRLEIEAALNLGKRVLPVLLEDADLPRATQLPRSIRRLVVIQSLRLTSARFAQQSQKLVDSVRNLLLLAERMPSRQPAAATDKTISDQLPEFPEQGYGPHFEIREDGIIAFAPPAALDRQGNNIERLTKLHPAVRELAKDLVNALRQGNIPHSHLLSRAEAYGTLIDQDIDQIDFALLYAAGVRLANAEKASSGDSDLPSLSASVRETVDSLLQLHATFISASVEGLQALAAEERYHRTPQEETEYRAAAVEFAERLQKHPEIVDPKVATAVLEAAEEIGKGTNPERSSTVATGMVKNVTITVSVAATLGALTAGAIASGYVVVTAVTGAAVLVAAEGLKKSRPFAALSAAVTEGIDKASEGKVLESLRGMRDQFKSQFGFFVSAEPVLRQLAGRRSEFTWLTNTSQWLKRQVGMEATVAQGPSELAPPPLTAEPPPQLARRLGGNIYLARVRRVEASISGAFLDYGDDSDGLLPFDNIHPDYYQIPRPDRERQLDEVVRAGIATEVNSGLVRPEKTNLPVSEGEEAHALHSDGTESELPVTPRGNHSYKIQDVIKRRQIMLVQVERESHGNKGTLLTTYLSVPGQYVSLKPNRPWHSIEISAPEERDRLTDIIQRLDVPDGMGIIIPASSASRSEAEIAADFERVVEQWVSIRDLTLKSTAPALIYDPAEPHEALSADETRARGPDRV